MKEIEANKRYRIKLVQLLTTILNLFLFGLSVAIFVIGILYLSAFYYKYSFSSFNPTVVAGIYVSFGLCIAFFSISNVICVNTDTKHKYLYLALSSFAIIILFVILLAIGIWGLSVYTDQDSLREEVKKTMYSSCLIYNNPSYNAEQTDKTNWLQTTFRCCGVTDYKDWTTIMYGYNSYRCFVPDACCINPQKDCARDYANTCLAREDIVRTRGCVEPFLRELNTDIVFLGAFTVSVSGLAILLWLAYILIFYILQKRR